MSFLKYTTKYRKGSLESLLSISLINSLSCDFLGLSKSYKFIAQPLVKNQVFFPHFRLGHYHQDKRNKPFVPNNPAEAKRLINQIFANGLAYYIVLENAWP